MQVSISSASQQPHQAQLGGQHGRKLRYTPSFKDSMALVVISLLDYYLLNQGTNPINANHNLLIRGNWKKIKTIQEKETSSQCIQLAYYLLIKTDNPSELRIDLKDHFYPSDGCKLWLYYRLHNNFGRESPKII